MKKITINVPDDCEVQIVRKEARFKKEVFNIEVKSVIRTYQDLVNNGETIDRGYWIGEDSSINEVVSYTINQGQDRNIASSKKVVKSMLAMSMISMLMPHYGGAITDEEWKDGSKTKYTIGRFKHTLEGLSFNTYYFLAFHTSEQRDNFLKYNERLVKDYLMID